MATWSIEILSDQSVQVLYTNPATNTFEHDCGRTTGGTGPLLMREIIGWCGSEAAPFDALVIGTQILIVQPKADA